MTGRAGDRARAGFGLHEQVVGARRLAVAARAVPADVDRNERADAARPSRSASRPSRCAAPGARFCTRTSAGRASARAALAITVGLQVEDDRLLAAVRPGEVRRDLPDRVVVVRGRSPLAAISTLMTRAPRSASCRVQCGAETACSRPTTRTPSRGSTLRAARGPGRSPCRRPRTSTRQPSDAPRRRSSSSIVTTMRAPVAAIGWPRLPPLPLTFTIDWSMPSLRVDRDRHRAERLVDLPQVDVARSTGRRASSAFAIAVVGAEAGLDRVDADVGPADAPRQRREAVRRRRSRSLVTTTAAAASLSPAALPAVTVAPSISGWSSLSSASDSTVDPAARVLVDRRTSDCRAVGIGHRDRHDLGVERSPSSWLATAWPWL